MDKTKVKSKLNLQKAILLVAVFLLALAGGMTGSILADRLGSFDLGISTPLTEKNDGNSVALDSEKNIDRVAQEVSPSVVSIVADAGGEASTASKVSAGTGIIVSKNGYVMTNKHVVSGTSNVTVTTTSGDVYEDVKIVGQDPLNDVAFLKIAKVDNLRPAKIGNSRTLRIGQSVVAIGNSLGQYDGTVTSGIISGLGRPVTAQGGGGTESLTDLIQTDAAINPGNSGGPLVNLSGQVVGINTAVADANGIGFAIPIDATKGILKSVLETGEVKKAYIGVRYSDITPALAKSEDLPVKKGALVTGGSGQNDPAVVKDGPADKAGIKEGDIIIEINGMKVGDGGNVSSLVSQFVPGTKIEVTYIRDKQEKTTSITLGEYEAPDTVSLPVERQESTQPDIYRFLPFGF